MNTILLSSLIFSVLAPTIIGFFLFMRTGMDIIPRIKRSLFIGGFSFSIALFVILILTVLGTPRNVVATALPISVAMFFFWLVRSSDPVAKVNRGAEDDANNGDLPARDSDSSVYELQDIDEFAENHLHPIHPESEEIKESGDNDPSLFHSSSPRPNNTSRKSVSGEIVGIAAVVGMMSLPFVIDVYNLTSLIAGAIIGGIIGYVIGSLFPDLY